MPPTAIHIHEDLAFQRRMYRLQLIGRALLLLIVLAAAAGFAGRGYASAVERTDASGRLRVRFQRFARYDASQEIEIHLSAGNQPLWIDASLLQYIAVESITPNPTQQTSDGQRVLFSLDGNGAAERTVWIHFRANSPGWLAGRIGAGEANIPFRQFVYP